MIPCFNLILHGMVLPLTTLLSKHLCFSFDSLQVEFWRVAGFTLIKKTSHQSNYSCILYLLVLYIRKKLFSLKDQMKPCGLNSIAFLKCSYMWASFFIPSKATEVDILSQYSKYLSWLADGRKVESKTKRNVI